MRVIYSSDDIRYRIVEYDDTNPDIMMLKGDCYRPECNPDIPEDRLLQEEQLFETKISQEGVYGYALEVWDSTPGVGYTELDSCWGFIGVYYPSIPENNHYIINELKGKINETA